MNTDYQVYIIHEDRNQWASELKQAIRTDLSRHALNPDMLKFSSDLSGIVEVSCPTVAVYFGSSQAYNSQRCISYINTAINLGIVTIPVVEDENFFRQHVPQQLHPINAFIWCGAFPAEELARRILRELGLTEKERKVFISYRRTDGLGMADQLFDNLSRRKFTVFLDRFDVESGRDFQQEIKESLEEIVFLLVIESPDAYQSKWIREDEVNYALKHHMAILIVTWPSIQNPIPNTEGLPRIYLNNNDLITVGNYQKLSDQALDRIVNELEYWHADGLLRRRRYLLESIKNEAFQYYSTCLNIGNWTLLLKNGLNQKEDTLLGITPRLPNADDLYRLDNPSLRLNNISLSRKFLIHLTESISKEKSDFLEWIIDNRPIQTIILEQFIGGSVL
ncbi:toll/interleukin-1 receptor domain-containing protein [candidate division NPL-UPA2 bacterium]|nr:toll/interleukin-1 receptor domain-containing protein [candidate division NPL-UPA2 bacterium]